MSLATIAAHAAETTEAHVEMPSKWVYGVVSLAILLVALWIITRLNLDR